MMQFRDLGAQYKALKTEIDAGIQSVIQDNRFIFGPQVNLLEEQLADYVGTKHCISCANGTDALILMLMAWDIGPGDAVFAPDFTFFATINCIMVRRAQPVLVDIDERSFNISPAQLEAAIQKTIVEGQFKPKAIIPVDLFGLPADYPEIERIAQKYGLKILEDGAQGFGGRIGQRLACSFGDAATTSFFPAKPLGCYGDGGAIFTNNDDLDETLRSIRAQGRSPHDKYDNRSVGLNSRLDTLQAAILLPKFKAFRDFELDAVNQIAAWYTEALGDVVRIPTVQQNYRSSWAQYTILLDSQEQRDRLQQHLKGHNIPSMVYYPRGMHQQSATIAYGCQTGDFRATERVTKTCLSLPMHPYLTQEDVAKVSNTIIGFMKSGE